MESVLIDNPATPVSDIGPPLTVVDLVVADGSGGAPDGDAGELIFKDLIVLDNPVAPSPA